MACTLRGKLSQILQTVAARELRAVYQCSVTGHNRHDPRVEAIPSHEKQTEAFFKRPPLKRLLTFISAI
jgi:hypothetical protein